MSVIEQARTIWPPFIILTDCAFDYSKLPRPQAITPEEHRNPKPVTREMVEDFLHNPWAHLPMHALARSWLELDDKLRSVSDDRNWWRKEAVEAAKSAEHQRQRSAALAIRLEKYLQAEHLEPQS